MRSSTSGAPTGSSATAATALTELEEIAGYHLEQAVRLRLELGPADGARAPPGGAGGALLGASGRRAFGRDDLPAAVTCSTAALGCAVPTTEATGRAVLGSAPGERGQFARRRGDVPRRCGSGPPAGRPPDGARITIERQA